MMADQVPKPRIFISHASSDSWVARQLAAHIRGFGADTFLDCEHIQHGDDFEEKIIDAAGDCTELLVLFTPTASDRKYVWLEIGMFLGAKWPGDPPAEEDGRPMRLDEVLLKERCEIWGAAAARALNSPGEFVCRHRPAALCLSGGGIRSAAFALGVLQGLARRGLLSRFHYLSTVSGGGYMGAWLARWIREARDGVQEVQRELAQSAAPRPEEPAQIRRLRERTNYITPKVGIASTDSWTAIALVIRNLLLNWLLLLPALMLAALVFNLYREVFLRMPGLIVPEWTPVMLAVISLPLAFAVMEASRWLPTHAVARAKAADHSYAIPPEIRRRIVGPAVAWSGLLPLALAPALGRGETFASAILEPFAFGGALFSYPALCTFGAAVLGYLAGLLRAEVGDRPHYIRNLPVWLLASAASALTLAAGVWLALRLLPFAPDAAQPSPSETEAWYRTLRLGLLVALAPLWATISHLLLSTVYAGFRIIPLESAAPGADRAAAVRPASELDREWLARLSAAKLQMPLLWALLAIACLLLPVLVFKLAAPTWQWVAGVVASASGVFAVLGGRSALTVFGPGRGPNQRQRRPSLETMLVATAVVFGAALLAGLAWLEFLFAKWLPLSSQLAGHVVLAVLLCVLVWTASRALKVNRFSLHGLYRNRLVRAFLGAARCETRPRQADPFTDFDSADNIRMCELRPLAAAEDATARDAVGREDDAPGALFPVVNLALNITGGDRLAWQERKAVSFTVTPLACGWTDSLCEDSAAARGAYVSTSEYGGNEADLGMEGTGISLGTAMTISGAAASPNMGYHSSAPVAFLLTLFNVRLGAWLPNPACRLPLSEMGRSGPRHAKLVRPALGRLVGRPFLCDKPYRNGMLCGNRTFEVFRTCWSAICESPPTATGKPRPCSAMP
jgi:hypothetical protein